MDFPTKVSANKKWFWLESHKLLIFLVSTVVFSVMTLLAFVFDRGIPITEINWFVVIVTGVIIALLEMGILYTMIKLNRKLYKISADKE